MLYVIKDAHIYVNQLEGIKEQLRREKLYYQLSKESAITLLLEKKKKEEELKYLSEESFEYKETNSDIKIIDILLEHHKPCLEMDPSIDDFFKFDNSKELKHVKVKDYKNMGKIKFPVTQ